MNSIRKLKCILNKEFSQGHKRILSSVEVQQAIDVMNERGSDCKDTLILTPYYLRAINTLRELLQKELG